MSFISLISFRCVFVSCFYHLWWIKFHIYIKAEIYRSTRRISSSNRAICCDLCNYVNSPVASVLVDPVTTVAVTLVNSSSDDQINWTFEANAHNRKHRAQSLSNVEWSVFMRYSVNATPLRPLQANLSWWWISRGGETKTPGQHIVILVILLGNRPVRPHSTSVPRSFYSVNAFTVLYVIRRRG